jgi:hypothetical protein
VVKRCYITAICHGFVVAGSRLASDDTLNTCVVSREGFRSAYEKAHRIPRCRSAICWVHPSPNLHAQPLVNIETVAVGDPGNAADFTGLGAVTNVFAIGKYEVTISQYATFLNSVASVANRFLGLASGGKRLQT